MPEAKASATGEARRASQMSACQSQRLLPQERLDEPRKCRHARPKGFCNRRGSTSLAKVGMPEPKASATGEARRASPISACESQRLLQQERLDGPRKFQHARGKGFCHRRGSTSLANVSMPQPKASATGEARRASQRSPCHSQRLLQQERLDEPRKFQHARGKGFCHRRGSTSLANVGMPEAKPSATGEARRASQISACQRQSLLAQERLDEPRKYQHARGKAF
jgi:hypothetical protein